MSWFLVCSHHYKIRRKGERAREKCQGELDFLRKKNETATRTLNVRLHSHRKSKKQLGSPTSVIVP